MNNTSIPFQFLESTQIPKLVRNYEKWEWKPHTTNSISGIGGQLSTVNREVMGSEWTGVTPGKLRIGDFPGAGCAHVRYCQMQESSVYGAEMGLSKGWPRKQTVFITRESRGSPAASAGCLHQETDCRSSPIRWEEWLKLPKPHLQAQLHSSQCWLWRTGSSGMRSPSGMPLAGSGLCSRSFLSNPGGSNSLAIPMSWNQPCLQSHVHISAEAFDLWWQNTKFNYIISKENSVMSLKLHRNV